VRRSSQTAQQERNNFLFYRGTAACQTKAHTQLQPVIESA